MADNLDLCLDRGSPTWPDLLVRGAGKRAYISPFQGPLSGTRFRRCGEHYVWHESERQFPRAGESSIGKLAGEREFGGKKFERKNRIARHRQGVYLFRVLNQSSAVIRRGRARQPARRISGRRLWRAVAARDARYDGAFVYAVRSTGIYCRPSCPSRRPSRKQILFFALPETAEHNGFRACRRCDPQDAACSTDCELIRKVCRTIEGDAEQRVNLAAMAREAGLSCSRLQRMFRRLIGITPSAYAAAVRLRKLKNGLREGEDVTTSMHEAGYGSSSRLYERSDAQLGMTPGTYRRGGQGMEIAYSVAPSPLGRLLVAGTVRGISAIYLGDSDAPLKAALRREYPEANIRRNPSRVSQWVREVVQQLSGGQPNLALPLDIKATAFQRRVWTALQGIPRGATRTYSEVAQMIGRPSATRAVARACATNAVSIVIPCHRVVRKDGDLGGYRWGLERKRALLEREKQAGKS